MIIATDQWRPLRRPITIGAFASILALLTVYLFFLLKSTFVQAALVGGALSFTVASWLVIRYRAWLINNVIKAFLVLFAVGLNTPAVTGVSHLELTDLLLISGFLVFMVSVLAEKIALRITALDFMNVFLLIALLLPITQSFFNVMLVMLLMKSSLISFLVTNFCVRRENLVLLVKALIILAIISALIGIVQEIVYLTNGYMLTGFIDPKGLQMMFEETSFGEMFRVPALTDSYKTLCFILLIAAFLTLSYILFSDISMKKKFLLSIAFLIIVTGFGLTFSNDGRLTLAVIFSLTVAYKYRRFALHATVLVIALAIVLVFVDKHFTIITKVYNELHQGEFRIRLHLDRAGVYGFLFKNTWLGVGMAAHKYTSHYFKWAAHNNFILAADEAGVLGVTALFSVIGYSVYRAVTLNLLDLQACDRPLAAGMLLSLLALVMLLQFHSGYIVSYLWLLMGMIQAMYLANWQNTEGRASPEERSPHSLQRSEEHSAA